MLEWLQHISILIELIIVVVSLLIATIKKKSTGYFLALTFAIYVFYDLAKLVPLNISNEVLWVLFFIATLSGLCAVLKIYWRVKK